jgi:hypothetical protein
MEGWCAHRPGGRGQRVVSGTSVTHCHPTPYRTSNAPQATSIHPPECAGYVLALLPFQTADGAPSLAQRVGRGGCVEDVKPFLLECPAYQHLRARYPCVFGDAVHDGTTQSEQLRLLSILLCDCVTTGVYTMTVFRDHCWSLPHVSHIAITDVQQVVEEDVELIRIQQPLLLVIYYE